jgi:hypothetical protein
MGGNKRWKLRKEEEGPKGRSQRKSKNEKRVGKGCVVWKCARHPRSQPYPSYPSCGNAGCAWTIGKFGGDPLHWSSLPFPLPPYRLLYGI